MSVVNASLYLSPFAIAAAPALPTELTARLCSTGKATLDYREKMLTQEKEVQKKKTRKRKGKEKQRRRSQTP